MIVDSLLFGCVAAPVAVLVMLGASAGNARAGDTTCAGGSIASGVYSNLNIAGACRVDAGPVMVQHNLTVLPGGSLVAVTGGFGAFPVPSDLTVGGNFDVQAGGLLNLGCEPIHYICVNDPIRKSGRIRPMTRLAET